MSDDWKPKGAAAKLAYIQAHVANPDKTGRNDFHKFRYIQEHGLIELLRPMLRELHCAVVPSPAEHEVRIEDGKTPKGRDQKMVTLVGEIRFIDTDEPADSLDRQQVIRVTAGGADDLDKAHAKAQTILVKYGIQKLFLIPTEKIEDGDADEESPAPPAPKPAKPAPAKRKTTAAPKSAIGRDVLDQLRATFTASGTTEDQLCWMLLSVGVQSLPGNPSRSDIGAAMKGLTLEQAFKLEELLKGEDGTVPGSGESS